VCGSETGKCRRHIDNELHLCMTYADAPLGSIENGFKCVKADSGSGWASFKLDNSQQWLPNPIWQRQGRGRGAGGGGAGFDVSAQPNGGSFQLGLDTPPQSERSNQRFRAGLDTLVPLCSTAEGKEAFPLLPAPFPPASFGQVGNDYRRKRQLEAEEQRQQRSLSEAERDKQYRQMLSELTLHPDDKADLIRRGFTREQIRLSGFKSIERYQPLQNQYSQLLPGVTAQGNQLVISSSGYLCPIRNSSGLIVAAQVRLRSLGSTNRYRWLSGKGQTLHLYPEGCSPKGELPLPVFRPQGLIEGIALAEGTGVKPFLVSQRLNLLTIGAAGGQWASSPQLFRSTLEKAHLEVKTKEILIFPDAGDILNPCVMNRWQKVVALSEEWGWSVLIGWWGQIDKTHPDIDELEDFSQVRYISPEDFWEYSGLKQAESNQLPEWREQGRRKWRKNRQFNADIKKASIWCDWEKPSSNSIFFGKAGLGRGKTTLLKRWVEEWKQESVTGFICLGYRNTLLLQLCEQLKFYHLHEHSGLQFKSASNEGIALCLDSLWRLNPEDFDDKIIIIDEVKSVIKHLLHSPTIKNRDQILSLFKEAIQRSRQVICLDGLLADWCVDYIKAIAPDKRIITIENTYKSDKSIVNFLMGTIKEWENSSNRLLQVNDRSPWLNCIMEYSEVPVICSDSQVLIEALDNLLTQQGCKTLRIDSKTVPEPYVKEFLSNCNAYIEKHQPDVLLYTPSAESGVDVSITNYFTHHFGFFFGVIDIDGILQMLGRIRDDIPKFVWCKEFVSESEKQGSNSSSFEAVFKSLIELAKTDILTSFSGMFTSIPEASEEVISLLMEVVRNSQNIDFGASCLLKSIENYEKTNLRDCLKEALLESGYTVRDCIMTTFEGSKKEVQEATKEVKLQNSQDIFNAPKIPVHQLKTLKFDAKWSERCKVLQAKIREQLPGIEDTSTWTVEFIHKIRYEDREFLSKCEMYWLFNHPEVAQQLSQEKLHWMARKQSTFIGNIKSRWAKVYALHEMGFDTFLDPSREWTNESPEVIALKKLGEKHSNAIGISPGKLAPMQYLSSLLSQLGLNLKSRKEGKTKRIYSIDILALNDPTRNHVLRCIEERLSQNRPKLNWEAAINEALGIPPKNLAQSQSQQAIQPPAPAPQNVYISDGSGVSTEIPLLSQSELTLSENAQLCLQALADLEIPGHPTIRTFEQLFELYASVEAVGQQCEEELPSGFWSRASVALGVVSESLQANGVVPENLAQTQPPQAIQPPAPAPQNVYISDGSGVSTEISAQNQNELALSEKARLCLEALADLETPNHPTICTHEQLLELFVEVEAVGQQCEEELPSGFWSRASVALGVVSESLESNTINAPTVGGKAWLVERLGFALNFKAFCRVISGWATEVVEEAIVFQDTQPRRRLLSQWLEQLEEKATLPELKIGSLLERMSGFA